MESASDRAGQRITVQSPTSCPAVPPTRNIERFLHAQAYTDAAIALFGDVLPDCGLKIVLPPAISGDGGCDAYACIWRRGEAQSVTFHGATPALAILVAVQSEYARLDETKLMNDCASCRGIGWYVTATGARQACRHGRDEEQSSGKIAAPDH